MASLSALQTRIEKVIELLPSPHLLLPRDGEAFLSFKGAKKRLQDYAFTQGFALVVEQNDKQRKTVLFDCSRHHKKQRNTSKVEEKDRQRQIPRLLSWIASIGSGSAHHFLHVLRFGQSQSRMLSTITK